MEKTKWRIKLSSILLKLESFFSRWRKKLNNDREIFFLISRPIRQADRFLKKLYPDDDFYRSARYAFVSTEDAKKLYLYGCARQVVKASMVLLHNEEFILEKPKKEDIDSTGRAILESVIDEQNIIIRKHIELLVNLINFTNYNKKEAYRIFLNLENLEHFLGRQSDFKSFYENKSENIDFSISNFVERINNDLKVLGTSSLFFLKEDWSKRVMSFTLPLFKSARQRYMLALSTATAEEKIVIGVSYDALFSDISVSAHATAGSRIQERHYKFSNIRNNISMISMLGQHIMNRANQLMGFVDPENLMEKMQKEATSEAPKLLANAMKVFETGDIVLAMGDLAEIVEIKVSKYGYSSCRVKFLTKPPIDEIPEDSLPCAFVISILHKRKVRDFIFKDRGNQLLSEEVNDILELMKKEPDEKIIIYVRNALIDMYKKGILIPLLLQTGYLKRRELPVGEEY